MSDGGQLTREVVCGTIRLTRPTKAMLCVTLNFFEVTKFKGISGLVNARLSLNPV